MHAHTRGVGSSVGDAVFGAVLTLRVARGALVLVQSTRCKNTDKGVQSQMTLYSFIIEFRGAPDRKISVRPDNRTGLIEARYRPDRALSSIVSDEGLFSELGNEDYEKLRKTKQALTTER